MSEYNEPRGIRNKNLGNIELGRDKWQGQVKGRDRRFVTFESFVYGYRAMIKILITYSNRGLHTVKQIISTWAPAGENDVNAYVKMVCHLTGMSQDTHIDVSDKSQVTALVAAMARVENGQTYNKDEHQPHIESAWAMLH